MRDTGELIKTELAAQIDGRTHPQRNGYAGSAGGWLLPERSRGLGELTGWAQDEHLALTGAFHQGVGVGVATFDLAEAGTGTLLRFSFRAIGVVDTEAAGAISRGWTELVGTRLTALVETGTRLGIDPDEPHTIRRIK
jgi:hypothetical protein